jgi:hypothetical protein
MNKSSTFLPKVGDCVTIVVLMAFVALGQVMTASAAQAPANVNVINTASAPVPVREVGPSLEPFQASGGGSFSSGVDSSSFVLVTVPLGKRLVIEYATVSGFASEGVKLGALIATTVGGTTVSHQLVVTDQGTLNDPATFAAAQPMRLYADPGTNVVGIVYRTPNEFGGGAGITISGYFADLP